MIVDYPSGYKEKTQKQKKSDSEFSKKINCSVAPQDNSIGPTLNINLSVSGDSAQQNMSASVFSQDWYQQILKLITHANVSSPSTANLATNMSGTFLNLINIICPDKDWMLDAGCNDHMTSNFSKFKSPVSCASIHLH